MGKQVVLHPTSDGKESYLTAELSGDYAGLIRLIFGQNKFGEGQGFYPSLTSRLTFEIQGVVLAA